MMTDCSEDSKHGGACVPLVSEPGQRDTCRQVNRYVCALSHQVQLRKLNSVFFLLCIGSCTAAATGNNNVRWMGLDLSLQSSIHEFVRQFKELNGHVDILINNAATTEPNERTLTPEGKSQHT